MNDMCSVIGNVFEQCGVDMEHPRAGVAWAIMFVFFGTYVFDVALTDNFMEWWGIWQPIMPACKASRPVYSINLYLICRCPPLQGP